MTEQRSLSAGLRSLPRVLPLHASSRALRSMSSSSTTSSASAAKTAAAGSRPSASGTAPARLAAPSGHPHGTSSPVASSTLREISGSGTDRTRGLRPDSPVPSRVCMGGPYEPPAPPAHFSYLNEVWDAMEPALRARHGSVTLHDAETSLERSRTYRSGCLRSLHGRGGIRQCSPTAASESGLSRLRTRRSLGSPSPQRDATALDCRGHGHRRTTPSARHLHIRSRISTATPRPRHDALSGLRHFLRPRCLNGFYRPSSSSGGWEHYASATSTGRPRAVHHRCPVVNCCCAPPPAASTNPPRRPIFGPSYFPAYAHQ